MTDMHNNFGRYILFLCVISAALSINVIGQDTKTPSFKELYPIDEIGQRWVDSVFNSLSLREKCAQLVFPYTNGNDPQRYKTNHKRIVKLVEEEKVGGILFLAGDLENQTNLINELQGLADVPLLISSDFERGAGGRIDEAVQFPYQMAYAASGNPYYSYLMGKATGIEARAMGVHQNNAPVLDVVHDYRNPIINIRAYSSNVELINYYSNSFLRGMNEAHIITTAKHFPGHGATTVDSHAELPLINLTEKEFREKDLKTFQNAINEGVKSIMVGHLNAPALSGVANTPATFSYNIVTKILKNQLGFDGLVVTDALNMWAITTNYTQAETAVLAVQAGNDVLLFPENTVEMIDGLVDAVRRDRLTEERIDESVKKILTIKKWVGLDKPSRVDLTEAQQVLKEPWHRRAAQTAAEKSITLVKDENELIPINHEDYNNIYCVAVTDSKYKHTDDNKLPFVEELDKRISYINHYEVTRNEKVSSYNDILDKLRDADLIILPLYTTVKSFKGTVDYHDEQATFINNILALNKPTVAISFGNPFLLTDLPNLRTYIAAYGNVPVSQKAAVTSILGDLKIEGKLPVSIPGTEYNQGYGLTSESKGLYFQQTLVDTNYDFSKVDSLMNAAIRYKYFPGAVLLVGHRDRVVMHKPYGKFTFDADSKQVDLQSIFDLASLTKVVATTSAVMRLYDEGKIKLDDKVTKYLPKFGNNGKENITIKNLLLHNSGFPSWKPFYKNYKTKQEVIDAILNMKLEHKPGEKYVYSDLGMVVMQLVIEKISGETLDKFADEEIFSKLDMENTFYNPSPKVWYNTLPTENDTYWRMQQLKGKVHDETAYMLEGVSGNAGLFSTAEDLSKLVYTLLNEGTYGDEQLFKKETVKLFTTRNSEKSDRALGWDTKSEANSSAGDLFSFNSFGHTGFTGTSIWVDKDEGLFVILLTNRIYPSRDNTKLIKFRPELHDQIYRAVTTY